MDDGSDTPTHVAIYRVVGELDITTAPAIFYAVDKLAVTPGLDRLVLDLSQMTIMDSSGLAVIVQAHNRGRQRGFELHIRGAAQRARRMLGITGLDEVLTFV